MSNYKIYSEIPTRQQDGSWIISGIIRDPTSPTPDTILARKKIKLIDLSDEVVDKGIKELEDWFLSWAPKEEKIHVVKKKIQEKLDLI